MTYEQMLASIGIRDSDHLRLLYKHDDLTFHQQDTLGAWFDVHPNAFARTSVRRWLDSKKNDDELVPV